MTFEDMNLLKKRSELISVTLLNVRNHLLAQLRKCMDERSVGDDNYKSLISLLNDINKAEELSKAMGSDIDKHILSIKEWASRYRNISESDDGE